ncbi:HD-GYP domain-containing protein [Orenia marismortui]|uniref:HD-GYP domain-containing protein (C-di-GMP phosphodiesterase class II) n=1 Tax=Orenia marismortui TaxID=46469 RepID=A0A4R8GX81_9FIRM|nr:HD-GYP domain-containing protein [Orenia marismortui]TDX48364.1 HD-GYP domain-containing protein (c-di-GMP phosphodiesterase class II) [Orenia marismortui]
MYLAKVSELSKGDILAKKIYNSDGKLLLGAGRKLNEKYINKLKSLQINHVYIEDDRVDLEEEDIEIIPEKIKQEAVMIAKECIKKINCGENKLDEKDQKQLFKLIERIVETATANTTLLNCIKDIRLLEDELFFHLTNVTVLSLIIGKKLDYNRKRLLELGLGAFLHDIGKSMVPPEILDKPGKLTSEEFEEAKKHTTYGYQILSKLEDVPEISARIAYLHHERCDGSGYPKGISKRFIDEYARIVAISDVFDAMVNDRVYRSSIKVSEVIEYLYTTFTENKMDRELLDEFLKMIVPYPVGTKVKLSIGCEAVVIKVNEDMKSRPIVRALNFNGLEIDLSKDLNIEIIEEIS